MSNPIHIYLFGDQTYDFDEQLRALLSDIDPVLTSFFERAFHAIRAQIGLLPLHYRERFPRFSSIADFLSRRNEGSLHPALEQALATTYHFGCFIKFVSGPSHMHS